MLRRCVTCAGLLVVPGAAMADSVDLTPSRDNTMYQSSTGALSNALGPSIFAGRNSVGQPRRALIRFEIAGAVPPGSTITGVSLTLNLAQTISFDTPVTLYRALADWGEGTSNAGDPGGGGALATPGDATWLHTFFDTQFWSAPGGSPGADYAAAASATLIVGNPLGPYTWASTPQLVADVQDWLDGTLPNFGWFVIGDESTPGTAKRFDSRESLTVANRPDLHITYTPPGPSSCYANCDASTTSPCLNVLDFGCFLNRFAAGDTYANCDQSTTPPVLNVLDFSCFLNQFAAGCSGC